MVTNLIHLTPLRRIGKLPRLLVSSADGYLYIYNIDPEEGGDCTLLKQHRYYVHQFHCAGLSPRRKKYM